MLLQGREQMKVCWYQMWNVWQMVHLPIKLLQQLSSLPCHVQSGIVMEENHSSVMKNGTLAVTTKAYNSSDL